MEKEIKKERYSLRRLPNFVQTFNRENIPLELYFICQFKSCGSFALPHPLEGTLASLPHPIAPVSETAELVPSPWQMPEPPLAPLPCADLCVLEQSPRVSGFPTVGLSAGIGIPATR